jgi:adenylate cyclase
MIGASPSVLGSISATSSSRPAIFGDGVNIAARLEALAEPGSICVSEIVHGQVADKVEFDFEDLGPQNLKNISKPIRVYRMGGKTTDQPQGLSAAIATSLPGFDDRRAIAVLPFANFSGDPEQEFFADGITEDIISMLAGWRAFPVIARNSTFTYKGKTVDIKKVGEELGVRYVLEGSVRKSGRRVRVTAQLIRADTNHHIMAERYDRDLTDLFELQDEIVTTIAGAIEPEILKFERDRIAMDRAPVFVRPLRRFSMSQRTAKPWSRRRSARRRTLRFSVRSESARECSGRAGSTRA